MFKAWPEYIKISVSLGIFLLIFIIVLYRLLVAGKERTKSIQNEATPLNNNGQPTEVVTRTWKDLDKSLTEPIHPQMLEVPEDYASKAVPFENIVPVPYGPPAYDEITRKSTN